MLARWGDGSRKKRFEGRDGCLALSHHHVLRGIPQDPENLRPIAVGSVISRRGSSFTPAFGGRRSARPSGQDHLPKTEAAVLHPEGERGGPALREGRQAGLRRAAQSAVVTVVIFAAPTSALETPGFPAAPTSAPRLEPRGRRAHRMVAVDTSQGSGPERHRIAWLPRSRAGAAVQPSTQPPHFWKGSLHAWKPPATRSAPCPA